ncbi:MAG: prolipoprotein diacylglyceryl transferase [Acidobacteria bacterium]|nr:prolipoprotein diacylglyceryl transferase [Acidobacteriota bacterium]MCA1627461.1 prolipoprotein diacylglyceryl transferase [Acidobacteriota bacterium]
MHPRLLAIDNFVIYTFGALMVLAVVAALWWLRRTARRRGLPVEAVMSLSVWLLFGGLFGAKLFKAVRLLLQGEAWSIRLLEGAGDFYGGFLGALAVVLIYFWRRRELPAWRIADVYGPALALGQSIGRIGCLMAGDDYGKPTNLPWAVTFTDPEAATIGGAPLGVPLHPVQLYESLACLALFFFLEWLSRRQRFPDRQFDGQVVLSYALGYAVCRFFIEFFRGDVDRGFVFGGLFSTSQAIALVLGGVSLILLLWRAPKRDRRPPNTVTAALKQTPNR